MSFSDHVHILMCTYNGADFIADQLESFARQDHRNWSLWVRDDGSSDDTLAIVQAFRDTHPQHEVHIRQGAQDGVAMNFLTLLCDAELAQRPGFVALSDQDDVWLPHRLSRGLEALGRLPSDEPALYGSRTILVDEDLTHRRESRPFRRPPGFANALVQNILAGNTMLLNEPALRLLREAGPQSDIPFHDWWIYQLLAGADATIVADPEPALLYRQHGSNTLGANLGRGALQRRLSLLRNRHFKSWVDGNNAALTRNAKLLTSENAQKLETFIHRHDRNRFSSVFTLGRHGIRRQSTRQTLVLYTAFLMGRF